jgi:hypothetical protein
VPEELEDIELELAKEPDIEEEAEEQEAEEQEAEEQDSHTPDLDFECKAEETLDAKDEIEDPRAPTTDEDAVPEDIELQVPLWIWMSAGRADKSICDEQRGQVVCGLPLTS